ncbi:MAG: LytTR family transcriptional regulator [Eubacterium sp.]|nr:LytTR family transcriptional regulator [Eubacterium sp.]
MIEENKRGNEIIVNDGKYQRCVDLEDISHISIVKHGCKLHMTDGGSWFLKKILDEVYSQVRDYDFTYAHSSYIVNLWHVTSIDVEEELLTLDTGEQLGISRSKRDGLVQEWIQVQEDRRDRRKKRERDYYKLEEIHQRYSDTLQELEKDVRVIHKLVEHFGEMQKVLEEVGVSVVGKYTNYFRIDIILDTYKEKADERGISMEIDVSREFLLLEEVRSAAAVMLDRILEYFMMLTERCKHPGIHVTMKRNRKQYCSVIIVEGNYEGKIVLENISGFQEKMQSYAECFQLDFKSEKIVATLKLPY